MLAAERGTVKADPYSITNNSALPYFIFPSSVPFLREHTGSYVTDFYVGCLSSDFKSSFFKDWSGSSPWMAPYPHLIVPAHMVRRFSVS